MKIKMDFVTNSSTTSFVAWGVSINEADVLELCGERLVALFNDPHAPHNDRNKYDPYSYRRFKDICLESKDDLDGYSASDLLEHLANSDFGLSVTCGSEYSNCLYIGLELSDVFCADDDNKSISEVKKEVKHKLDQLGLGSLTPGLISLAWYNG